ncbi:MAG TPA: TIGR03668 family PPOX class F420-dependent oxidoreductase [Candidatus Limnocylindrales bacterium]|nr:TIGR03668 family PPOX class F420-dependent oxidoreductase [Candidatus Limnocylindrales bacterium]
MTPEEARERFAAEPVARLATVDARGLPHIVPITFAVDGNMVVSAVDGKPKRGSPLRRLENIAATSRVSLLVDHYHEDWRRLWWVRADGAARIVADGPELASVLEQLRDRYAQYRQVALIGPAIVVEVDAWIGWAAAG